MKNKSVIKIKELLQFPLFEEGDYVISTKTTHGINLPCELKKGSLYSVHEVHGNVILLVGLGGIQFHSKDFIKTNYKKS